MSEQEEPSRKPIDPQTYASFAEGLNAMKDKTVSLRVHSLLMNSVAEAIADIDLEKPEDVTTEAFLTRVADYTQYQLRQLSPLVHTQESEELHSYLAKLRLATAFYQQHHRERSDDTSDT